MNDRTAPRSQRERIEDRIRSNAELIAKTTSLALIALLQEEIQDDEARLIEIIVAGKVQ